jgi:hypothetical protein
VLASLAARRYNPPTLERSQSLLNLGCAEMTILRLLDVQYAVSTNMSKKTVEMCKEDLGAEPVEINNKPVYYKASFYPEGGEKGPIPQWFFNIMPKNSNGSQLDADVLELCDMGPYVGMAYACFWPCEYLVKAWHEYTRIMLEEREPGSRGRLELPPYNRTTEDFIEARKMCEFILDRGKLSELKYGRERSAASAKRCCCPSFLGSLAQRRCCW